MDSLTSALPGTSSYVGYPLLRGVPLFVWDTSNRMGYLYSYGVPLFVWETSNCAGYFYLCGKPLIVQGTSTCMGYLIIYRAPQIVQGTSDCAEIIPLVDTWRSIAFPIFPSNTYYCFHGFQISFKMINPVEYLERHE